MMAEYIVRQVVERDTSYVKRPDYLEEMEALLNEQAEAGYHLHTALSGKKSISFKCDGNDCQKITLIFEKDKKETE